MCLCKFFSSLLVPQLTTPQSQPFVNFQLSMSTIRLISSFCLGHDLYCGGCIGHLRWCVGISGGRSGHITTRASYLWHKWRLEGHCPLLLRTKTGWMESQRGVEEQHKRCAKSSRGHFKDCMWWWTPADCVSDYRRILQGVPPPSLIAVLLLMPLLQCSSAEDLSVGDTVQAGSHCLLELKHISDQTAGPDRSIFLLFGFCYPDLNPFQFCPLDLILLQLPQESLWLPS